MQIIGHLWTVCFPYKRLAPGLARRWYRDHTFSGQGRVIEPYEPAGDCSDMGCDDVD